MSVLRSIGFGFLMLDRFQIAGRTVPRSVSLLLAAIDLALFVLELGKIALRQVAIGGSQTSADFLAARFDSRIITARSMNNGRDIRRLSESCRLSVALLI